LRSRAAAQRLWQGSPRTLECARLNRPRLCSLCRKKVLQVVIPTGATNCHPDSQQTVIPTPNKLSSRPELLIPEGNEKRSGGIRCFAQATATSKKLRQKKRRKPESLRQT
jgi:hypothetical protein